MMDRYALVAGAMMVALAGSISAGAQSVANYKYGMAPNPRSNDPGYRYPPLSGDVAQYQLTARGIDQVRRWGKVGQCVAATDRASSLSYVSVDQESSAAIAAAERLAPAFATCFASSGIVGRTNAALRRAALADALKIKLVAGS